MTEHKYGSGWGAVETRIAGGTVLAAILWVLLGRALETTIIFGTAEKIGSPSSRIAGSACREQRFFGAAAYRIPNAVVKIIKGDGSHLGVLLKEGSGCSRNS
jgi:hypothetical protein